MCEAGSVLPRSLLLGCESPWNLHGEKAAVVGPETVHRYLEAYEQHWLITLADGFVLSLRHVVWKDLLHQQRS